MNELNGHGENFAESVWRRLFRWSRPLSDVLPFFKIASTFSASNASESGDRTMPMIKIWSDPAQEWSKSGQVQILAFLAIFDREKVCRTLSHFIVPSQYWIDSPEEKNELFDSYKKNLSSKDCRHFNFGDGECPFSVSCFYRHAYKDGTLQVGLGNLKNYYFLFFNYFFSIFETHLKGPIEN